MVLRDKNTVDFNKGLSPEEKRNKRAEEGIEFGQVKAGEVAAYNFNSGSSIKTITPGKLFSTPPPRVNDGDSFAGSVVTFDVASTVAQVIEDDEDDSSISSVDSLESMDQDGAIASTKKKEEGKTREMKVEPNKEQVSKEAQPSENISQEDEAMASEFEQLLKIMDNSDKEKFMKMDDNMKRELLKYLDGQRK